MLKIENQALGAALRGGDCGGNYGTIASFILHYVRVARVDHFTHVVIVVAYAFWLLAPPRREVMPICSRNTFNSACAIFITPP